MHDDGAAFFLGLILGLLFGAAIGHGITSNIYKREAVAAGVAEYRSPSPDSPERTFTWKTNLNPVVERSK